MSGRPSHADQRLRERTTLPPEALARLRRQLRRAHLPKGTHHVRLGSQGYAVLKDTGRQHVVATVLSRHMTPPGKEVSMSIQSVTKEAAAKWRALVRAGQLSAKSLNELKGMGLYGTEGALAKETAGIIRGNEALAKKHGINLIVSPNTPWYSAQTEFHTPMSTVRGRPIDVSYKIRAPAGGATSKERFRNAVVTRHEVDEARSLQRIVNIANKQAERVAKKTGKKPDYAYALDKALKVRMQRQSHILPLISSAHVSPFVITQEAGHYNMGGGAGLKKLRYLFRPQDTRQVGEWAGRQLPYTKLPQAAKKVGKTFEREVREEIRTGVPKDRSRWFESVPALVALGGMVGGAVAAERSFQKDRR